MFEIYNEKVFDLLNKGNQPKNGLPVRMNHKHGFYGKLRLFITLYVLLKTNILNLLISWYFISNYIYNYPTKMCSYMSGNNCTVYIIMRCVPICQGLIVLSI